MQCPKCGEENPARAKFCLNCAEPLAEPAAARHEVRKTVTIVFVDVTGSTNLGEQLDPETLRRVMERYFDEMRSAVQGHGGLVEKFIGDAVMAVFGLPIVHEDDALRATRAASEMRERLADLNGVLRSERGVELQVRIGVNTGQVVAGDPSGGQALVTGDAVNVAARLEQAAQPGQILLGEETYKLVHGAVETDEVRLLSVKGKDMPVAAHPLRSVDRQSSRRMLLESPMLGRDGELELVTSAFDRTVRENRPHLFTILGSAGVGKSRLVAEVLSRLEGRAAVHHGRCLSYGQANTFWPIQEVVKEAADLGDDEPNDEARRKVEGLLGRDAGSIGPLIEQAIGLVESTAPLDEIFYAIRKMFEIVAKERPLVVVFDDIHWGEPAFLDLIEHIADWSRDAPILLMCVARPDLLDTRPSWGGGKLNASSILLEPLGDAETNELIEHLLGGTGLDDSVHQEIVAAAEGNPLFVEEMIGMMVDDSNLIEVDGRWQPAPGFVDVVVPPTIQALLAARLDLLGSEEREVIEAASVVGLIFPRSALAELLPERSRAGASTPLMSLVRKELVRIEQDDFAGSDTFRFRHLLIRDAAYNSMPKETRARMHEVFARWLIETAGERLTEFEEIVAHHLERAYELSLELGPTDERIEALASDATDVLLNIGDRARARDDLFAAVSAFGRAVKLMSDEHPRLPSTLRQLAVAQRHRGAYEESMASLRRGAAAAERQGNEAEFAYCSLEMINMDFANTTPDWTTSAEAEAKRWLKIFMANEDHSGCAFAYSLLADVSLVRARWIETEKWASLAMEQALLSNDMSVRLSLDSTVTAAYLFGPIPVDEAIDRLLALENSETSTPSLMLQSRFTRAPLHAMRGEFDVARELIEEQRAYLTERGYAVFLAAMAFIEAPVEECAGNLDAAIAALRDSHEQLKMLGERSYRSTLDAMLALTLNRAKRYDEAEAFALEARDLSPTGDDASTEMAWRAALAVVYASQGKFTEAIDLARQAREIADRTDFCNEKAEVFLAEADVHEMAGDLKNAIVYTRRALELYEQKGNIAVLDRVRARLDELTATTKR